MEPDGEGVLEIRENVSWAMFQKYIAEKHEKAVPRVTYLDGVLELVTPSRAHERTHSWVGVLLDAYTDVAGIDMSPFGSWLLQNRQASVGAEPDACFVIGAYEERTRPDFVVEVQWSRRKLSKLEVYRRLGVNEVWIWDSPRAASMDIYVYADAWSKRTRSGFLPDLDLPLLCTFLDRPTVKAAKRDYLAALTRR